MTGSDHHHHGLPEQPPPAESPLPAAERKRRARWLYAPVVIVQIVALIGLWLLQATYGR